ncbi:MAG: hypothetical protein A3G33_11080 [Omnitrophica bacterium RIFCSPLOWO2_12_FULL_44_17]|uniref:Uncharacterized protein n=1 Tax=Candidatus Danuiimicrobium aquiferis TaxID=1801832 RepID=A0A1G1KT08_9BACT|nr:MAG: hypothetical protein A3B72_01260 [Omnitrophica bacterium RIFCSPHIGHO2_02_FULL_45_28]OGW91698.1 MAG: hypothetical protein A3E74_09750 [Omnitrophica bacterium RIFCSPHIGHO2_12_FULL_44_12]OGW96041.1 MAG: hypothetical protein A3G33_11080 [Omnitrophica bacterium RIFCSPLOWO2_12_FULL_44_17]OGX02870.1 MAG: hypothetical protein A3J12_05395 [Omnitrophica bacterium RIFCSPLOWO2_02_FULL_44_11]
MTVLENAIDVAKKEKISTIVIASTTGGTALKLFELAKGSKLKLIVVTHDEGRLPQERRFKEEIRRWLLVNCVTIYTHNIQGMLLRRIVDAIFERFGLPAWHRHLRNIKEKFGTGIKVCHIIARMLIEGNILRDGRVVVIAGKGSGADSSAVFFIKPRNKWPILEKVLEVAR